MSWTLKANRRPSPTLYKNTPIVELTSDNEEEEKEEFIIDLTKEDYNSHEKESLIIEESPLRQSKRNRRNHYESLLDNVQQKTQSLLSRVRQRRGSSLGSQNISSEYVSSLNMPSSLQATTYPTILTSSPIFEANTRQKRRYGQRHHYDDDIIEVTQPIPLSKKKQIENSNNQHQLSQMSNPKNVQCTICLTIIQRMAATICGHVFCESCIKQAIHSTKRCPICRTKLSMRQIHPLYL